MRFRKNKYIALFMSIMVLIFGVNISKPKSVQAFVPLAIAAYEVGVIAAEMVAEGAVGTIATGAVGTTVMGTLIQFPGQYVGTLATEASQIIADMPAVTSAALANSITISLAAGYFINTTVPDLWTYLKSKFLASSSIPKITASVFPADFTSDYQIFYGGDGGAWLKLMPNSLVIAKINATGTSCYYRTTGYYALSDDGLNGVMAFIASNQPWAWQNAVGTRSGATSVTTTSSIIDGIGRAISIPAAPEQLNNATKTSTFTNTANIVTTAETTPAAITQGDTAAQIYAALVTASETAKTLATTAALSAGFSVPAADAAGAAAKAAIMAGATVDAAAEAGRAAAISYVSTNTGALTTDIAKAKADDKIDWTPLKLGLTAFTTKFPFSLPWDLKHLVESFISVSAAETPVFSIVADSGVSAGFKINRTMSLEQYNGLVGSVRAFEKIIFLLGLLLGTRKLLGGAT